MSPLPCLPVDSAISCSAQSPKFAVGLLDAHLVAALPPAFAELEAQLQPGVRLAAARVRHPLGVCEQALGVDAHQRSGNDSEGRQRRVPAADRRLAVEHAHPPLPRELLELRAGIGDYDELLRIAGLLPEVGVVRQRLERRPRLGGDDEHRLRQIEGLLRMPDHRRVRRVEHVQLLLAERPLEDLGRERRPAHAEQDERVELRARAPVRTR